MKVVKTQFNTASLFQLWLDANFRLLTLLKSPFAKNKTSELLPNFSLSIGQQFSTYTYCKTGRNLDYKNSILTSPVFEFVRTTFSTTFFKGFSSLLSKRYFIAELLGFITGTQNKSIVSDSQLTILQNGIELAWLVICTALFKKTNWIDFHLTKSKCQCTLLQWEYDKACTLFW